MTDRPPVLDWTTDFDHLDPRWVTEPHQIWDELRRQCPIAHTERYRGVYFPSRYADIRAIAYDTKHFSSRRVVVREMPPRASSDSEKEKSSAAASTLASPPITSDPPHHRPSRMLLLPAFTPDAISRLEPKTRKICRELIDRFASDNGCDAAADYAQHVPVAVIAHMLGLPEEDGETFRRWIQLLLHDGIAEDVSFRKALDEMDDYFRQHIAQRRSAGGEDLITFLLKARMADQPLSDEHILGTLRLLLIAGIDTTWSAIGSCLWHLAQHRDDRRRLLSEPALMPTAIEEFLRAYAPVTMARQVAKETTVGGCPFKEREMVLLSFPAANRDPEVFPQADRVVIDRTENRHAAFGLGIHRCIGSNLARMEITVALEEWLARIPDFELTDPASVIWSHGPVRGPRKLPLVFK
ncbi:MAG: cytochrome P450 [Geminicoccaceae bacterium]|jgi:cytochrome P450|nr:MAG: cytochrome P450 [Enhydrobacter sp.]